MIYAGDQWIQYPVKDLYDKAIMQMSIAAAKDMYEKGQKQLEDFNNKYGDFMSPIAKDMDWYNQNVTGKVRDTINNLYANGIDPLRSAEGRAAVAQLIYSMPTGDIAKVRQSADAAKEYIKNRGKLEAAGLYNQDLEERFLGFNLNNWGTIDNGVWNRISPLEAKSLKELTESSYNNRTPHDLTKEEVLSFAGQTYDPRMKYKGFTDADLLGIANTVAPGLTGTPWNDYYRDLAAREVAASGMELSDKNINAQLARDIANTQQEYLIKPIGDLDDWYKQQQLNISRATHALAKKQYDDSRRDQKIGLTDIIKDAVRQKINSAPYVNKTGNKQPTKTSVIKGQDKTGAISNYNMMTVPLQGEAAQSELEKMFYGWSSKADEKYDIVNGQNRKRITFTETSGLYPTLQRAYDYKGYETKGLTSAFTKYLRRNKIYGYPLQEDFTVTYNANANNNIFDVNQYVEINKDQLEGFFKQRYTAITHKSDYSDQAYEDYKKSAMRQLGISEQPSIYSKIPINDSDNKLQWQSKNESYLIVPITRSKEIVGLGQSQIDTDADKDIVSKDKLSEVEKIYQERDIKRRNK